ncbi:MAG: nicotinate (nicotinamide) nucleotide adenylyltransferase [Planctomycetes bacterium]|nr:nicotinate (nicotinamide) nucleotide adenylyltransferase [Planctomycetota bacterium]
MASRRLAFLGGSFDPVHLGHLHLARAACERLALDTVRFLPAPSAPHKLGKPMLPVEDRIELLGLALAGEPRFGIEEHEARRGGSSYTIDTLRYLRRRFPSGTRIFFLIGGDSLRDLPQWRSAAELVAEFDLVTVSRDPRVPDDELLAPVVRAFPPSLVEKLRAAILRVEPLPVSSTEIRERVRQGLSIDGLVPPAVAQRIAERGHYRAR